MVEPVKPTRAELQQITGTNRRMLRAFESLFDVGEEAAEAASQVDVEALTQAGAVRAMSSAVRQASDLSALNFTPRANGHSVDYVDFLNGPHVTRAKRLQWNDEDGTLDIGLNDEVVLQVGQEIHYYAKNTSGSAISNGDSVMATGAVGASGKIAIAPAVSDGSIPARYMIGVATENIAVNDFGYVTSFGLLRGLDTSAWSDGDLLYFDPATPGGLTTTPPSPPSIREAQAIVIHSGSGGSGSIFVRMTPSHSLADLQDVSAPSLSNGDILVWVAANSRWEAAQGASGSFTSADGKTVTVSGGIITSIV